MPLDTAAIMSTVLEGILYGECYNECARSMPTKLLFFRLFSPHVYRYNLVIHLQKCMQDDNQPYTEYYDGLVRYRDTFPGGPAALFADVSQVMSVVKNVIIMQTLAGNGVVSCFEVFGTCMVYDFSQALATSDTESIFTDKTGRWAAAYITFTFVTNMFSSGLLAYGIWTIECKINSIISIVFYMVFIRIAINKNTQEFLSTVRVLRTVETERGAPLRFPMETGHRRNNTSSWLTAQK
ncbi:hypothetical protein EDB19DRAFT_1826488 [Suillus lakei]|nr:hypothetical protein EDB19DRAFT_1826488 [Suillus lakei]